MKPFCLLKDPETYRALDWDLVEDTQGCAEWLEVFEKVFVEMLHHCSDVYGRGVETNYDAVFDVDVLRICLIKNESVAQRIGGENFDCVCRFAASIPGRRQHCKSGRCTII